jgi:H+/Cl- antiporter ClcA
VAEAQAQPLGGRAYLRLILIGGLIGIPAALVAAGLLLVVHQLEEVLWHDLPDGLGYSSPPWFLVIALPVVGAAFVAAARALLPGDGGHEPLAGISMKPVPVAAGLGVALAAIGTLSFGAVLGPEGPLIALGSVVGVGASRLFRVGERESGVLSTAGSASAISALFGGPLPAGILLVEGGLSLGTMLLPVMIPGLVSAAIGYVIFIGIGDWGGIDAATLLVPGLPAYDVTSVLDMAVGAVVGVLTGAVIVGVRQLGQRLHGLGERGLAMPTLLLAGGLAVGLLAELADVLGANSQDVLFSGQASMPSLVAEGSAGVVIVLLVAKALAYGICLGCGFRGGPVFPAIFVGTAVATLAVVVLDVSPTVAVAVGTAAGTAAATRLMIVPLLIAALLVGTNGLDALPAAVLAAAAAWVTTAALDPPPAPAAQPG